MDSHDALEMEVEEPLSTRVEQPPSNKWTVASCLRFVFILDDVSKQNHHWPVFIVAMSILHVSIFFLIHICRSLNYHGFAIALYDLGKFFLPCMRPTPHDIRTRVVRCESLASDRTCYYDDIVRHMCSSFAYPHQLWRMVTVSLLHLDWLHLLSNLSAQLVQGIPLERKYGSARVAAIYWLSGLGASLIFTMKIDTGSGVGASGCLYGLMLFLIMDRLNAPQMNSNRRLFILIQLALLLLPYIVTTILLMIRHNVAHLAHVGGGLVGFLLGIGMLGCPWPWNDIHHTCVAICRQIAFVALALYYALTLIKFVLMDAPILDKILNNFSLNYDTMMNRVEVELDR